MSGRYDIFLRKTKGWHPYFRQGCFSTASVSADFAVYLIAVLGAFPYLPRELLMLSRPALLYTLIK